MEFTQIISFVGLFLGCSGLWTLINKIYENYHKDKVEDPIEKLNKKMDSITEEMKKLTEALDKNSEVTMSHARDRLNALCNKYMELGYIPEEEFTAFILLGDAYIKAGGNHGFDELFRYVKSNYKVVSKSQKNGAEANR